jgi:serine/threonine protein kinase
MCYLQTGTPRLAHRDLKPGNVFVLDAKAASQPAGTENASASGSEGIRRRGEAGSVAPSPSHPGTDAGASDPALAGGFEDAPIVVVADFGLARDEEEASTPEPPSENGDGENGDPSPPSGDPDWTGETGTYLYMAPEVVRHESYDASCDVWSFGVMLDELIAGAPPYRSQRRDAAMSPSQIAVGVADGAVAFETAADSPPGLAAIVRKCVERDPKDRPSFAEVCDALDAMLPSVLRDLEEKEKEASRNSLKNQLGVAFRNVVAFVEETASTVRESLDIRDPDSVDAFEETEVEASTVSLDAFLAKPRGGEAGANAEGGEAK